MIAFDFDMTPRQVDLVSEPFDVAIRIGEHEWLLTIRGLSMQRGPAPVAQQLYEEDADSHARRQQQVRDRTFNAAPEAAIRGRPTKRDRRLIHRFTGE